VRAQIDGEGVVLGLRDGMAPPIVSREGFGSIPTPAVSADATGFSTESRVDSETECVATGGFGSQSAARPARAWGLLARRNILAAQWGTGEATDG
jgi:hypothetical protein